MLFNRFLLSFLFLNLSLNNFVLADSGNLKDSNEIQVCDETGCPLTHLFNLEGFLENPEVKEFYDNLNDSEKADFLLLIKELNIVSEDVLNKLVNILQKYENLVTKLTKFNNNEDLNLAISITNSDLEDIKRGLDNNKLQEFLNSINSEDKVSFETFYQEMKLCFKDGVKAIANLFDLYQPLKNKYKNYLINKELVIFVGFDQDQVLPFEYLVV